MADIEAAGTAPPEATLALRAAAAAALRELLALAAESVVLCFASAVWVNNAALIASIWTASWTCGRAAGFPDELFLAVLAVLGLAFVLLFVVASVIAVGLVLLNLAFLPLLLLACRLGSSEAEAGEFGGDGGAERPGAGGSVPESTGARGRGDVLVGLVVFLFKAVAVGLLILLVAPAKGYCGERVCSMFTDIRCFPYSVHVLLRRFLEHFGKR